MGIGSIKTFTYLYLGKNEIPSTINLNKISARKKIVTQFPIWDIITHKIQAIVSISSIANTF